MAQEDTLAAAERAGESILYEGANLSQMCALFKCDRRTLKARMHGILPVKNRGGYPIYDVSSVAERMGKMTEEQVDAAMQRLNHDALPKALTKEYWAGKRSRQAFERDAGDLWPTSQIVRDVGELVKTLNMELNLLIDGIERQVEMTERQRDIAKQLVNGAKDNMLKRVRDKFQPRPVEVRKPIVIEDDDEL